MAQFSICEAKANLSKLIAAALSGRDVVIAQDGVPVVRLIPFAPSGRRCFGALKEKIAIDIALDEPLPDDELHGWSLV